MTPAAGTPSSAMPEPEIHVIPDKYYGAALKARVPDAMSVAKQEPATGAITQAPKGHTFLFVGVTMFVILFAVGGAFYYFNPGFFSPAPTPAPVVVVTPPPPPTPPNAPTDLVATSTNPQSVSLSWTDAASDESGFRVERADASGVFQSLTGLPPNSTSFLDVSVQPGSVYRYRVVATNLGGDSSASNEAPATVPPLPPPEPVAPKLPPAGLDSDSDGLTDLEESLYGTRVQSPDTDADGFLDGNEVFHLYNPNGLAPARLIDAKLVKQIFGTIGWRMQVPTAWTVTLNGDGATAMISSGHGEDFKLSVESNPNQSTVLEWYLASHPGIQESQVLQYRSKKGYEGIIGADLLTTYIPWGDRIFVFTYDLDDQPFINYRTTYSMMLNSLELNGLPQISPTAIVAPLPFEPAATTTGVITQPVPVDVFPSPTSTTSTPPEPTPAASTSSVPESSASSTTSTP